MSKCFPFTLTQLFPTCFIKYDHLKESDFLLVLGITVVVQGEDVYLHSERAFVQAYSQTPPEGDSFQDRYGDAVAWGGCTILYLLGQQWRFELLDFAYHILAAAEAEALPSAQALLEEKSKSGSAAYPPVCPISSNFYGHNFYEPHEVLNSCF